MAARGARAAAGDADDRIPRLVIGPRIRALPGRVPRGPQRGRFRRGPQRRNRISLGGWPLRSPAGARGGVGSRSGGGAGRDRHHRSGRGQGRDLDGSDRFQYRRRPGQVWPCRQPQQAGRKCHRRCLLGQGARGKAVRVDARAGSQSRRDRLSGKPEQCGCRARHERRAGCGGRAGAEADRSQSRQ